MTNFFLSQARRWAGRVVDLKLSNIYVSQRLFINVVLRRYNRVNWKLLLVDLAKIQYTRDGKGPDLRTYDFMFDSRWKQVILANETKILSN
jgi:hypothetical protein